MSVVPHRSNKTQQPKPAAPSPKSAPSLSDALAKVSALRDDALKSRAAERIAKIADNAAQQTKQATESAVAASKVGLARAAEIGRETVLPELERTGAKLKERTKPERLKQDYKNYLFWLHNRVLDPPTETLFFKPTKTPVSLDGLTIRGPNRGHGHDYRPSPCAVVKWTLTAIDYDLSQLTFVDYGAGKGRVLLLASEHPFAAIGGIEFAEELHDDAVMNIAQYPRSRMQCRNVECVLEDASALGPPEGESVHYFFSPFSREVFAEVLHNLVVSYRKRPRRLYLILIDPIATDLIDNSGVFTRLEVSPIERLKLQLLSPYEVALYRTLA